MIRQTVAAVLARFGLQVVRTSSSGKPAPAPLVSNAVLAYYRTGKGSPSAFMCHLDACRTVFGFGFGQQRWHPFAATMAEIRSNPQIDYGQSILRRYYELWHPNDASESVVGFKEAPEALQGQPPYAFVPPWAVETIALRVKQVQNSCRADYVEHDTPPLDVAVHGYRNFGPVSDQLGSFEHRRSKAVLQSILSRGYVRDHGDVEVNMVRRRGECIFVGGAGLHRRAAMTAAGYQCIPAVPRRALIVDVEDVDSWPSVASGLWTQSAALKYVDHLFDFDSRAWAANCGLLSE